MKRKILKLMIRKFFSLKDIDDKELEIPLFFTLNELRKRKRRVILILLGSLFVSGISGSSIYFIGFGIKALMDQASKVQNTSELFAIFAEKISVYQPFQIFLASVIIALVLHIIQAAFMYFIELISISMQVDIEKTNISKCYKIISCLDYSEISLKRKGELSFSNAQLLNLSAAILQFISIARSLCMILGYGIILAFIAPYEIFVLTGLTGLALWAIVSRIQFIVRKLGRVYAEKQKITTIHGWDLLQSLTHFNVSGTWNRVSENVSSSVYNSASAKKRYMQISALVSPTIQSVMALGICIGLIGGSIVLGERAKTVIPDTLISLMIVYRIIPWINSLNLSRVQIASLLPQLQLGSNLISTNFLPMRNPGSMKFIPPLHSIEFKNVVFKYSTSRNPNLNGISFKIEKGKSLGIVGPSGSGKSTILNLIIGLYTNQGGEIYVNDIELIQLEPESWRKQLGVVSQDPFLYHTTLKENILDGEPWNQNQFEKVLKISNLEKTVHKFPDGMETIVGDRGTKISGGEKQRVSLARALYRNPQLLILDEATSSLDSESEKEVKKALDNVLQTGMTLIAVAHRLSTIKNMDEIVFIESGKILERGNHNFLLDTQTRYSQLWNMQSLV